MSDVLAPIVHPGTALSARSEADVDVIVVIGGLRGRAEAAVRAAASMLARGLGVDQFAVVDVADVAAVVEAYHCPLVVAGVTRSNLKATLQVPLPLLAVGPRCDVGGTGTGVVVGLDGSRRSEAVLPLAARTATALAAGCELFHVARTSGPAGPDRAPSDLLEANYLGRLAAGMGEDGSVESWEVLHGEDAAAALVDRARRRALIALNTHGESAAATAPIGRTAAHVLWDSPVPVLLSRRRAVPRPAAPQLTDRAAPHVTRPAPRRPVGPARTTTSAAMSYRMIAEARPGPGSAPSRRSRRIAALVVGALVTLLACIVPLPYYAIDGSTRPVGDFLTVEGADGDAGEILVTIVETRTLTAFGLLRAWWDPSRDIRAIERGDGAGSGWDAQVGRHLMARAGRDATVVALAHLGLDPSTHDVGFDSHGLSGPSAGLALALGLVDLLEPGDLTGGHRVAVTGALADNGTVVAVAGVAHKAAAARAAAVEVFIVPVDNYREAARSDAELRVIGVSSLQEAIAALRQL